MAHINDLEVKVTDFETFCKFLKSVSSEASAGAFDTLPEIRYWSKI